MSKASYGSRTEDTAADILIAEVESKSILTREFSSETDFIYAIKD